MSDRADSAGDPQKEMLRSAVKGWAESAWGDPCGAVSFRWKRFSLKKFEGRQEIGTMPLWCKIGWTLSLPVLIIYAWIRQGLEEAGATGTKSGGDNGAGTVSVRGTTKNDPVTSLIDSVKRAPRDLWIVFSRSRLMIVVCHKAGSEPRVVWQTDDSARLRFNHAARDSIEITWPDKCRAAFYPTFEERKVVTDFVRATWNDHEGRRG